MPYGPHSIPTHSLHTHEYTTASQQIMPVRGSKKKKADAADAVQVPAHTQLKEFRITKTADGESVAVNVKLGCLVPWPSLLTRPIIEADVSAKMDMLIARNGWVDIYSIYGRELSAEERDQLKTVITYMRGDEGHKLDYVATWRQARLHIKVGSRHTHGHTPRRIHQKHSFTYTHTHTHTPNRCVQTIY
jgi:hypothetical protein